MIQTQDSRTVVNPAIKDRATFLETSAESGGKYTLIRIELAPGGGNGLHYHKTFEETFTVEEGVLGLQLGNKEFLLKEGESATVPVGELHRFFNPSTTETVVFRVLLQPGSEGFERTIQVVYGLAADKRTLASGVPKNLYHMALIVAWSDTNAPGFFTWIAPVLKWMARRAMRKGIDKQLIDQYVKI